MMVSTRITTADELFAKGSDAPFELIQGELLPVSPSSPKSNLVLGNIYGELRQYVRPRKLGFLFVAEAGFLIEVDPDTVIAPDVAYVRAERMTIPLPDRGFAAIRPDLIVEVISPTDERLDIRTKQSLYERVAIPMVWWIDPQRERASIRIPGESPQNIERTGWLDGGSVLPGFRIRLDDLFDEI